MISPSNTHDGLTHAPAVPGMSQEDEPEIYYPTGVRELRARHRSRDLPRSRRGCARRGARGTAALRLEEHYGVWARPIRDQIKATAPKSASRSLDRPSGRRRRATPRGRAGRAGSPRRNLLPGSLFRGSRRGPGCAPRPAREGTSSSITNESAGHAAPGMYLTTTARANESLGPAGRRFLREFAATQPTARCPSSLRPEAAQAAEALLEAIERSDGTEPP